MCRSLHKCGIAHLDEAGLPCTAYNAIDPVNPLPAVPGDALRDDAGSDMDISSTSDMSVGYYESPPSAAASDAASVLGDSQPPSLSADASSAGSATSSRGGTSDHSSSSSSASSHDSNNSADSD